MEFVIADHRPPPPIMEFSYVQSLMSTAFLTLERYILIAKPFDYDKVGKLFFF